jgi:hypothetical protein
MTDSAASSALVPTPPLSEAQRVVDTFIAPSKTFTDLLRSSVWWGPFLVMLVVSILFSYSVQQKVGWVRAFENNIHQSPKQEEKFAQMPADQAASAKAVSAKVTQGISYGYAVVVLIFTAINTLLVWVTVNFGFGGTAKYGQVFAVNMYASLVMNIKYLLASIALFAGLAPDSFLQQNPVGTNVGYYFPPDSPKWLLALFAHVDIFEIWSLVLAVIGVAIVAKVSRGRAAIAVVGWWAIVVLIAVGAAAM